MQHIEFHAIPRRAARLVCPWRESKAIGRPDKPARRDTLTGGRHPK
jgi:hypothetical protein